MALKSNGPGAEIVPIRATAKMYVTIWRLPDLTWARSAVGIDVRPGAFSRGDYSDITQGLKALQLIRKDAGEIQVHRSTSDTEMYEVTDHDGTPLFRIVPSGSAFSRMSV